MLCLWCQQEVQSVFTVLSPHMSTTITVLTCDMWCMSCRDFQVKSTPRPNGHSVNIHPNSSELLRRSHITQYRCGYCKLLLMIINSWTRTASAAYASKIMTLTTAHSLPWDMLVYHVLESFRTLDRVCVEPDWVPSSEYAFKNQLSATIEYLCGYYE